MPSLLALPSCRPAQLFCCPSHPFIAPLATNAPPHAPPAEAVAGLVAAFVGANHPDATEDSAWHEVEQLLQVGPGEGQLIG